MTFTEIKDYSGIPTYTNKFDAMPALVRYWNDNYLSLQTYGSYLLGLQPYPKLYAGVFQSNSSTGLGVYNNDTNFLPSMVNTSNAYDSVTLIENSVAAYVVVQQVKSVPMSDIDFNYWYPLYFPQNSDDKTRPKTSQNTVYSKSAFLADHGNDWIVSGVYLYSNDNDGEISSSNPRVALSTESYVTNDLLMRFSATGIHNSYYGDIIGDVDVMLPVFTTLFSKTTFACMGYVADSLSAITSFTNKSSNEEFNTNANQNYKLFSSKDDISNILNRLGVPWSYTLSEITDKNSNNFSDYTPAGQASDTTGGGNGTGDNLSDSVSQYSPKVTPISSFNNHYAMSQNMLGVLATSLWGDDFLNNIHLLFNNPAEGVISCKLFPFSIDEHDSAHVGGAVPIVIGNVTMTAEGYPISSNYNCYFSLGSILIEEYYGTALDYAPYTTIQIYLPYIGIKELDASEVMGKTLSVTYIIDITSGACVAELWTGSQLINTYEGKIGTDIPINSTNAAQFSTSLALTALSGIGGVVAGVAAGSPLIVAGAAISTAKSVASNQLHINKGGVSSPTVGLYMPQYPYIIISRPIQSLASTFGATKGFPCNVSKSLGALTGYTEVDSPVLNNIPATEEEKTQIKNLLETGVIFA